MKKLSTLAVIAIAAASLVGCGNSAPKANFSCDEDSLAYSYGLMQGNQYRMGLAQEGIDSTCMNELISGINEGANNGKDKKILAHAIGVQIGRMISEQMVPGISKQIFGADTTKTISRDNVIAGMVLALTGKQGTMTPEQAQIFIQNYQEKQAQKTKKASEDYIAKVSKEKGVQVTSNDSTKIYYKEIKKGTGEIPSKDATVMVNYEGKLVDGTVFDSNKDKEPVPMPITGVIPGFTEALTHMPIGSKWEIYIPWELAYGERAQGPIPAYSALTFTVEVVSLQKAEKAEPAKVEPAKEEKAEKKH